MQAFSLTSRLLGKSAKRDTDTQVVFRPHRDTPDAIEKHTEELRSRVIGAFGLPSDTRVAFLVDFAKLPDPAESSLSDVIRTIFDAADAGNRPPFRDWDEDSYHLKVYVSVRKSVKSGKRQKGSSISIGSGSSHLQPNNDQGTAKWYATVKDALDQYCRADVMTGYKYRVTEDEFWQPTKAAVLATVYQLHPDLIGRVDPSSMWGFATRYVSNVNKRVLATNKWVSEQPAGATLNPNSIRNLVGGHSAGASLALVGKHKAAAATFETKYGTDMKAGRVPADIKELVDKVVTIFEAADAVYGCHFDGVETDTTDEPIDQTEEDDSLLPVADNAGLRIGDIDPLPMLLDFLPGDDDPGDSSAEQTAHNPALTAPLHATASTKAACLLERKPFVKARNVDKGYEARIAVMESNNAEKEAEAAAAKKTANNERAAKRKREKLAAEMTAAESDAVKERDAELAAKSAQVAEMQKTIKALQQKHAKENEKAKGNAAARLPLSEIRQSSFGRKVKAPADKEFDAVPVKKGSID